ncbi:hypothetical protein L195_g060320, partial [Trifolium pratense]
WLAFPLTDVTVAVNMDYFRFLSVVKLFNAVNKAQVAQKGLDPSKNRDAKGKLFYAATTKWKTLKRF